MTLAEIRRKNLRKWMDQNGMKSGELATAIGRGRAYASLLFREDRHFGEKSARRIEQKLRMPVLHLDSLGKPSLNVSDWGSPLELQDGLHALVPHVLLGIDEEKGEVVSVVSGLPPLGFTRQWLLARGVTNRDELRFCRVNGSAMEPLLHDGDVAMIDRAQHGLVEGGVYAIRYGREIRVRKLFSTLEGRILIRCINQDFPDETVSPDAKSFSVLGRKLWRGG